MIDSKLTAQMLPTLRRGDGDTGVTESPLVTAAEDFSVYSLRAPSMFVHLGITPPDSSRQTAAPNHSPRFYVDERAFPIGMRVLAHRAVDFLELGRTPHRGSVTAAGAGGD